MSETTPSDLLPIGTIGDLTQKGAYFFLIAAARGEIDLFKPTSEGFYKCHTSFIKNYLNSGPRKSPGSFGGPGGPIESIDSLHVSKSVATNIAGKTNRALQAWMPNVRGWSDRTLQKRFAKAVRAIDNLD